MPLFNVNEAEVQGLINPQNEMVLSYSPYSKEYKKANCLNNNQNKQENIKLMDEYSPYDDSSFMSNFGDRRIFSRSNNANFEDKKNRKNHKNYDNYVNQESTYSIQSMLLLFLLIIILVIQVFSFNKTSELTNIILAKGLLINKQI
jgi:hypothetical protein